jgi:hypothetical protein
LPSIVTRGGALDGVTVARWLLGAAQVGNGPTAEQGSVIQNLLVGYFGVDVDVASLEPIAPDGLGGAPSEVEVPRLLVLLAVVEFCRHPGEDAQADRVEEYERALGHDEGLLLVARDALTKGQDQVMADWSRFKEDLTLEPTARTADERLAARLRALRDCPPGSLGRAYSDFYDRWGLAFPGEEGGGDASLVAHDFGHVLAGYEPDAPGELALQAMLTSATDFQHHFSGLVASLSLYEAGKFDILGIAPRAESLARPGAASELADAFRRGSACTEDFSAIEHLGHADEPLDAVRARCGIGPQTS